MATNDEINSQFFDRPVAGESLTTDPSGTAPWEQPPKHVDVDEAIRSLITTLSQPKNISKIMSLLQDDAPVTMIARTILFSGFSQGGITPDMMLLMYEPIAVYLITVARSAGIDPVLYPGEHNDMSFEDELSYFQELDQKQLMSFILGQEPGEELTEAGEMVEEPPMDQASPVQSSLLGGPQNAS